MKQNTVLLSEAPPQIYSELILQRNLDALYRQNPLLVNRICLPARSQHILFDSTGHLFYRLHREIFPLNLQLSNNVVTTEDKSKSTKPLLALGIQDGEALKQFATGPASSKVVLWERDPWLLRLFLMRYDCTEQIHTGTLQFALGIDILKLANIHDAHWSCNRFLAKIYRWEISLAQGNPAGKKAVVCTGGLFVEDVCEALAERGYSLYQLEVGGLAIEELHFTLDTFRPDVMFSINYTNGLAEICAEKGLPLIIWEIDPATDRPQLRKNSQPGCALFTYNKKNIAAYQNAGFSTVHYLPLATNPRKRTAGLSFPEKYRAAVSFVGASMQEQAQRCKAAFVDLYEQWRQTRHDQSPAAEFLIAQCLAQQRHDFSRFTLPQALEKMAPNFIADIQSANLPTDPIMQLGELAAAEKRADYLTAISTFDLKIWGDDGWQNSPGGGWQYMGPAGHHRELNFIYCGTSINIDISRIYQMGIITMRVFDILSCGGFLLTEANAALLEIFQPGVHLETYRNKAELVKKTDYYLAHLKEARAIAVNGQQLVRQSHKISDRLNEIFKSMPAIV